MNGKTPKPVNQWIKINRVLVCLKFVVAVLTTLCIVLGSTIIVLVDRDTLVVGLTPNEKLHFIGERGPVPVNESDVVSFAEHFIELRYNWDSSSVETVIKEIAPIVTDGFLSKLKAALKQNQATLQEKSLAQRVIVNEVKLQKDFVLAKVDRIVSLKEHLKVVSPLELSIKVIKGRANKWNPLGLYVNAVTEFEEK